MTELVVCDIAPNFSSLSSMLLSIFTYTLLVILLAMSNWDRVLLSLAWTYSLASRWLTTTTILVVYGLVLLYLLLVVHGLAVAQNNTRNRRKIAFVPYYDEIGAWRVARTQ